VIKAYFAERHPEQAPPPLPSRQPEIAGRISQQAVVKAEKASVFP